MAVGKAESIIKLPVEILMLVFSFLSPAACVRNRITCVLFKEIIDEIYTEEKYKKLLKQECNWLPQENKAKEDFVKIFQLRSFSEFWVKDERSASGYVNQAQSIEIVKKVKQELEFSVTVFGKKLNEIDSKKYQMYLIHHKKAIENLDAVIANKEKVEKWTLPDSVFEMRSILSGLPNSFGLLKNFIRGLHELEIQLKTLNAPNQKKHLDDGMKLLKLQYN